MVSQFGSFGLSIFNEAVGRTATYVVAASDASASVKAQADYVCDGVADEVTIDAAITAVRALGGGIVHLSIGTFTFAARLLQNFNASTNNVPVILEGEGDATIIDGSAITAVHGVLNFWGLRTATTSNLTVNADEGTNQVVLSAGHGLVAGDWIMIEDTTAIGANVMADIHQVLSATADTLTLTENLFFSYTTAESAKVTKLIMVPNLVLRDFKIIATNASHNGGVLVDYGLHPRTEGITCVDTSYYGVRFDNTLFGKDIGGKRDYINWTGYGYPTLFSYACRSCLQAFNTITNSIKAVTIGGGGSSAPGIARSCTSTLNHASDCNHGYETHGEDADSDILFNSLTNCYGHPFSPNGISGRVIGNKVKNHDNDGTSSNAAVEIGNPITVSLIVTDNEFSFNPASASVQKWGVRVLAGATGLATFICRNNTFTGYAAGQSVVEGVTAANRSVGDNIAVGDVTTDSLAQHVAAADPWTAYTPTLTNLTLGNGTVTGSYCKVGKLIVAKVKFALGSTSAVGTAPRIGLPVTALAAGGQPFLCTLGDWGAFDYFGQGIISSTTDIYLSFSEVSGTLIRAGTITSTAPFTWTTSDSIQVLVVYEAA